MEKKKSFLQQAGFLGNVLSIGFTGGVCMAISLFIGYQIDHYLLCEPWGIIAGIVMGIAAAVIQTWKQLQESMSAFTKRNERSQDKDTQI